RRRRPSFRARRRSRRLRAARGGARGGLRPDAGRRARRPPGGGARGPRGVLVLRHEAPHHRRGRRGHRARRPRRARARRARLRRAGRSHAALQLQDDRHAGGARPEPARPARRLHHAAPGAGGSLPGGARARPALPRSARCGRAPRLPPLRGRHRGSAGSGADPPRAAGRDRAAPGLPPDPPGPRPVRLSERRAAVGGESLAAVLSLAHRRRGGHRGHGAPGGPRVTQPGPVPLRPPAARATDPASLTPHLARLALLGLLVLTPIWGRDHAARLPWLYLVALAFAVALVAIAYGVVLNIAPHWVPGFVWLNVALTILWFVTVTNAVQFLDGMDGLAGGLGVIAGVFFSIAALQTEQRYLMYLSAALVGACLGFLPYNFRPGRARIFLGDSGATFIGFTLAGLAVMGEWAEDAPMIA